MDFDIGMILVPLLSIGTLFILTKLMGYRQFTQLSMFDYIIGITIGSIAGELITIDYDDILRPIIGMIMYTFFTIILSIICRKSVKARKLIEGQPIIMYENDCLYNKQLIKSKMNIDEFLMQCRAQGYFNLEEIDTIILENNGSLSFIPKEKYRPTQVDDLSFMGKNVEEKRPPTILIKEGKINQEHLDKLNKDRRWLDNTLKNANIALSDVLLMYMEQNSNVQIFTLNNKEKLYK